MSFLSFVNNVGGTEQTTEYSFCLALSVASTAKQCFLGSKTATVSCRKRLLCNKHAIYQVTDALLRQEVSQGLVIVEVKTSYPMS